MAFDHHGVGNLEEKKKCMRDGNALCTDLTTHGGGIAIGDVNWTVCTTFNRSTLYIHGKLKQVTKKILSKRKGSQKTRKNI